jgi:membrane-bound lytic murein transglycosylase B
MKKNLSCLTFTTALILTLTPGIASADYTDREEVRAFIDEVATRNQLDPIPIHNALAHAQYLPRVIDLIKPPATRSARSWQRYRAQFLDPTHINAGLQAWDRYADALRRAENAFGVPPEIILGILGVETIYGRNTGNFETLSALATLAFDYPPRAELFRGELESLFLLAQEQKRDPASYTGSFAGALGWPQFLPSSVRRYAVDFDGDGQINFNANGIDAIGSIANYLREYGWEAGGPIAIRVQLGLDTDPAPLIEAGIEPTLTRAALAEAGIRPLTDPSLPLGEATLVDLETPHANTEYWLGYRNFYVITRYNRSSFYAMAIYQLAQALKAGHEGTPASALASATPQKPPVTKNKAGKTGKAGKASKTSKAKTTKATKTTRKAKPARKASRRR